MSRGAFQNVVEYLGASLAVTWVDHVPLGLSLAAARGTGSLAYALLRNRRRLAIRNVLRAGITTDEAQARRIAKESFRHFSMLAVESLAATKELTPETFDRHVEMDFPAESLALMDDPKQGILFVTAHLGNWEMTGSALSLRKPLVAVARRMDNPLFTGLMRRRNPRRAMEIVEKHAQDRLSLLRALRSGRGLALIVDQHAASNGIVVPFFGIPASTVTSPARLHLATRCPIIVGYGRRLGPLRIRIQGSAPLRYEPTGNKEADVERITRDLNDRLETLIRECPEQYLWSHRRWRVQS